jgi:hypothetical protein
LNNSDTQRIIKVSLEQEKNGLYNEIGSFQTTYAELILPQFEGLLKNHDGKALVAFQKHKVE